MDVAWANLLPEQLEWHWSAQARPRLDGLTDDEMLWEPVAGCWSIRPRAESTAAQAAGAGEAVLEYAWPVPDPPPVTTIAWRLGHVAVGVFGERAANHFGAPRVGYGTVDWPRTADGMLALLDEMHTRWADGLAALDEDGMRQPCGPSEGPYADYPMAALVLHINREAIHHLGEVALLRDLYRAQQPG